MNEMQPRLAGGNDDCSCKRRSATVRGARLVAMSLGFLPDGTGRCGGCAWGQAIEPTSKPLDNTDFTLAHGMNLRRRLGAP